MLRAKSAYVLLLICCLCVTAYAQSSTATLSGTVVDQDGAVVPGANITVINAATAQQRQATTNDRGDFTVPLLPPATYTIRVERQGFAIAEVSNVVLNVNDQKSLQIQLKAGNITEMVKITADAPLINESPAVGTVVDRQFAENLPLNGRSFQSLITLTPGVVLTVAAEDSPGQFSVNGQRPNANYFTVDGVSANVGVSNNTNLLESGGSTPALSAAGGTNSLVSVDALQEFKVLTSTYAPEFGRTPGGQVQIVTRSGTNEFRGTLFEYFRNDALDANDWFANSRGLPKPALRQNDFGGVLGGPIVKKRTFFFLSYEGLRLRQPLVAITDVPNRCLRGLGGCAAGQSPAAASLLPYLNAFPLPSGSDRIVNGVPNGLAEFAASFSNPSTLNATSIRVDHNVNEELTLFGRYNHAPSSNISRGGTLGGGSLNTIADTKFKTQTLTLGSTQLVSSNLSNELRFNYTRTSTNSVQNLDNFGGAVPLSDALLFPSFTSSQDALFGLQVSGGVGAFLRVGKTQVNTQDQINIVDNVSLQAGSHQWKFGIDYRRIAPTRGARTYDQFVFASLPALITGRPELVSILAFQPNVRLVFNNFSAYGQDTWKITPHLTLTYGLRWEINPPPTLKNAEPPFAVTGIESPATLALAPQGTALYKTTYGNIAPRIGVSYQLFQNQGRETVLRGGFGIFYDLGNAPAGNLPNFFPYRTDKNLSNIPFPVDQTTATPTPFSSSLPVRTLFIAFDPGLQLPRTYQWNVAVEQSLGVNQTVSASYVGAIGRHLIRQDVLVAPNPNFTSTVQLVKDTATSDYHAMQLQFTRRLVRGLQALASYTWSHSIDDASGDSSGLGRDRARGPSDFDIVHSFSSAVTYNIPSLFREKIGRAILGGWSLDTIVVARSAAPVNVVSRTATLPSRDQVSVRPDLIQGVPLYVDDPSVAGGRRINRAAFSAPQAGQQGNLGRNALRGFSIWQADLVLRRQFKLTERSNLQFRAELFNIFNHPNFGNPIGTLSSATFGQSTIMFGRSLSGSGNTNPGTGMSSLYQIGGPRSIQFGLKVQF